jgi:hypothetical protein
MARPISPFSISLIILGMTAATPAWAGPPFLTDDPEPTETGHWEIYAPLLDAEGSGTNFEGSAGVEINYGAAPNVQITLGLPIAYAHDSAGTESGMGDVDVSLKYRFYHNEDLGLSIAVFPGLTLPTASNDFGAGEVTGILPIWFQKDSGPWSVFGGGGYAFNPGAGNRDYLTGALAVSRQITSRFTLGVEIERQGADTVGGNATTSLGMGAIYQLNAPYRLLASIGPTFEDGGEETGFHAFLALGFDF